MTLTLKLSIAALALVTAFAAGRYLTPERVRTEIKTVEVERTREDKHVDRDRDTVEITKPDGTKIKRTKTKTRKDETKVTDKNRTTTETKVVEMGNSRVSVLALAGTNITGPNLGLIYGLHVSRPLIGPATVGGWYLTNGTAGIALGLQF